MGSRRFEITETAGSVKGFYVVVDRETGVNYLVAKFGTGGGICPLIDKNEICGQKITLYNLQYHNNFSQKNNLISWGSPTNTKAKYMELVVELGNDTLRISNAE